MSIEIMTRVWANSKQKGSALLLMVSIADYANERGVAYPSIETLARKVRMSERNVQLLLRKLEEAGEIAIKPNAGPAGCNLYRIILDEDSGVNGGEKIAPPQGENFSPGGEIQREGGEIQRAKGVKASSPDPSLDPPIDPSEDDHAREVQPQQSSSSSSPASSERIKQPAAAIEALIQPNDRGYLMAKIAYEDHIGIVKGMVPDMLKEALRNYPAEWIPMAIERAVAANVLEWRYVKGILQNWSNEGFNGTTQRINTKQPGAQRTVPAVAGQYDWSPDTIIAPADLDLSAPAGF